MKKQLIILLLFLPLNIFSQGWSFEYSVGYGSYKLKDIRSLQNSLINHYGLEVTDQFPNYITHTISSDYAVGSSKRGISLSYLTTGGRLDRADYSGSYTVDMVLNAYRLEAYYRYHFYIVSPALKLYCQVGTGAIYSTLDFSEQITIYSESTEELNNLRGLGIFLEPSLGASYRLNNLISFTIRGGYEADFLGSLRLNGSRTTMKAHWNGLRVYGGIVLNWQKNRIPNE